MRTRAPRRSFEADLSSFDSANNFFNFAFPASSSFSRSCCADVDCFG